MKNESIAAARTALACITFLQQGQDPRPLIRDELVELPREDSAEFLLNLLLHSLKLGSAAYTTLAEVTGENVERILQEVAQYQETQEGNNNE